MEHALKEVKQQLEEEKLENEKVKLELEQVLFKPELKLKVLRWMCNFLF